MDSKRSRAFLTATDPTPPHPHQALYQASFSRVQLQPALEAIGNLLGVLVTLDEIAGQNRALRLGWAKYKRMARAARDTPEKYSVGDKLDELSELDR